jgi:threonine aldolase
MNKIIDLRTDTITRPTETMLSAMAEATQGDDSRDGDETVMKLEALAAERTGKEAGAYMPSGTMTNLVAVLTHGQRSGEVLLEQSAHILVSELGGIAGLASLFHRGVPGRRGAMDLDVLREKIRPMTRNNLGTALVCMETTHNQAGGAVLPLSHMKAVYELSHAQGIPVHTDGARLFNAAVALGVDAKQICQYTDSIGFCVSKGLSAPVGSVLCGSKAFIERARAYRRMVGGNMRQAGSLAAAGIVALNTMVDRLKEDHATAKRLAAGLEKIDARYCRAADVETNLVRVDVSFTGRSAEQWSQAMAKHHIAVAPADPRSLRFVTHRHVAQADVGAAISAWASVAAA